MSQEKKPFFVSVSFGERGTIYGCGHALDTFLFAFGLTTEEETWEWRNNAQHEARKYVLDQYDWEAYTRDRFNEDATANAQKEIKASEYLAGDWFEINRPEHFAEVVSVERERVEAIADDNYGNEQAEGCPSDLLAELNRAEYNISKDCEKEWLNNDYHEEGILDQLSRKLTGERGNVEWLSVTDVIVIRFYEDSARDFMGYEIGEDDPIVPQDVEKEVKRYVLAKCEENAARRKSASEAKRKEWEKTVAYKKAQADAAAAKKIAEAVARKKKKTTPS